MVHLTYIYTVLDVAKILSILQVPKRSVINPNRSLDRICLDLLLPSCFLPALVRLPASALSLHLDVARYAFDETSAHLLNNRTKSVKDSNDRFGIKECPSPRDADVLEA